MPFRVLFSYTEIYANINQIKTQDESFAFYCQFTKSVKTTLGKILSVGIDTL